MGDKKSILRLILKAAVYVINLVLSMFFGDGGDKEGGTVVYKQDEQENKETKEALNDIIAKKTGRG